MKNIKENQIHAGHRNRLREKVRNNGLNNLSEHEVIELILNYVIPRQNTNPLAHKLINYFGSLSKVLDADYYSLLKVDGVGKETALYLNIISSLMHEYKISKAKDETRLIKNTLDAVEYFRRNFGIQDKEIMHVICLSKMGRIVSSVSFQGENDAELNFDFKVFMDKINVDQADGVIMFHTHPKGKVEPSVSDLQTTQRCVYVCSLVGVKFLDHLILNETEYCSMQTLGKLNQMRLNSQKLVNFEQVPDDVFGVDKSKKSKVNLDEIDLGDISLEEKLIKKLKK